MNGDGSSAGYHVGRESRGWIRGIGQRAGESAGRGGERRRSGVRAERGTGGGPGQLLAPRGGQRTGVERQRARGLVEVTLRIGHYYYSFSRTGTRQGRERADRRNQRI